MRHIACAFCPALVSISPTTFKDGDKGEHLWPDWLNRVFLKAGVAPTRYRFHTMQGSRLTVHRRPTINYKQPVVCEPCNNNWMSVLEQHARNSLAGSVVKDAQFRVSGVERERLARWAVKSAVVLDHTHLIAKTRSRPFYMPQDRFALRHPGTIPSDVIVNMFRNSSDTFTLARATYSGSTPRTKDKELKNIEVFAATFAYGRVGFQVVKFKFQDRKRGTGSAIVSPAPGWVNHTASLWPPPPGESTWPPPRSLDFNGMWHFAHQWVDHTPEMPQPVDIGR